MDHLTMTDDLERRLRAARPPSAEVDEHAFDPLLLARIRELPVARRRRVPRTVAVPVAVGVTAAATAAVMLAGPGDVGGPSRASALTQTLRWLNPPSGTVLHARSIETEGSRTTTHEFWQSADHPQLQRERIEGGLTYEVAGDTIYDPATNTIYTGPKDGAKDGPAADKRRAADIARSADDAAKAKAIAAGGAKAPDAAPVDAAVGGCEERRSRPPAAPPAKLPANAAGAPAPGRVDVNGITLPAGDPIVTKVRVLLQMGHATVVGRERHNGVATWAIALNQGVGRPVWRLWVDADSGRPVELRDPGQRAGEPAQVIRWTTYEVLHTSKANAVLTLAGAHPSAHVVHDLAQWQAAEQRLLEQRP